ncbi:MAG: pseudouridine synthase, RluA family, 23S rRNA pseudouridine1911/1915/1917 synthase [Candidatus Wolfebacteria bacterium GW2011_GWB1_47_1]|nr:MAG: pseudouridine synthase, RluA family, 23S rRNA pseudouridine1911/1915/1917 synthase [Candidatus Wolfebacteria bacterium GW2011_GWB1_47_1]
MERKDIIVIYEDKNLVAINKPAHLLVHPYAEGNDYALTDWLLKHYPEVKKVGDDPKQRPGIVHRLDKNTSGVILVPRTQEYFAYLKNLFQTRGIKKAYLALVWGKIQEKKGIIDKPISLKGGTTKRTVHEGKMTKEALTEYEVVERFEFDDPAAEKRKIYELTLVRAWPKTGRTHQIRVHLASIGHAIVGDTMYGAKMNPLGIDRHFLHAESLEFVASQGHKLVIEAELATDLQKVLKKVRG